MVTAAHDPAAATSRRSVWALLPVIVVALNLRPAVVALAPLIDTIRADTGLSAAAAGGLTTAAVLCFGLFSPFAPRLASRIGLEPAVALALLVLTAAILLRLIPSPIALFAGTLLAGAGIAVVNVLMPAFIKRDFVRAGTVTGLYSASLSAGAALSSGLTVPLMHAAGIGWRAALALWAVLAVVGLLVWLPSVRGNDARMDAAAPRLRGAVLLRDPLARRVVLFLGLQSVEFYSFTAWFPALMRSGGSSEGTGGVLLAVSNVVATVAAVVMTSQTHRFANQRPLVWIVVAAYTVSLAGLAAAPTGGGALWASIFGVGQGAGFGLGLALIVLRSPDPPLAAALSGLAQCVGYLIAAAGPFLLGVLHDGTGGWTVPMLALLVLVVPMAWAGHGAARDAQVHHPDAQVHHPDAVGITDP